MNLKKISCFFLGHDYTSAAQEGLPPTQDQLDHGVYGFWQYAKMYCKRCGHIYHNSQKAIEDSKYDT